MGNIESCKSINLSPKKHNLSPSKAFLNSNSKASLDLKKQPLVRPSPPSYYTKVKKSKMKEVIKKRSKKVYEKICSNAMMLQLLKLSNTINCLSIQNAITNPQFDQQNPESLKFCKEYDSKHMLNSMTLLYDSLKSDFLDKSILSQYNIADINADDYVEDSDEEKAQSNGQESILARSSNILGIYPLHGSSKINVKSQDFIANGKENKEFNANASGEDEEENPKLADFNYNILVKPVKTPKHPDMKYKPINKLTIYNAEESTPEASKDFFDSKETKVNLYDETVYKEYEAIQHKKDLLKSSTSIRNVTNCSESKTSKENQIKSQSTITIQTTPKTQRNSKKELDNINSSSNVNQAANPATKKDKLLALLSKVNKKLVTDAIEVVNQKNENVVTEPSTQQQSTYATYSYGFNQTEENDDRAKKYNNFKRAFAQRVKEEVLSKSKSRSRSKSISIPSEKKQSDKDIVKKQNTTVKKQENVNKNFEKEETRKDITEKKPVQRVQTYTAASSPIKKLITIDTTNNIEGSLQKIKNKTTAKGNLNQFTEATKPATTVLEKKVQKTLKMSDTQSTLNSRKVAKKTEYDSSDSDKEEEKNDPKESTMQSFGTENINNKTMRTAKTIKTENTSNTLKSNAKNKSKDDQKTQGNLIANNSSKKTSQDKKNLLITSFKESLEKHKQTYSDNSKLNELKFAEKFSFNNKENIQQDSEDRRKVSQHHPSLKKVSKVETTAISKIPQDTQYKNPQDTQNSAIFSNVEVTVVKKYNPTKTNTSENSDPKETSMSKSEITKMNNLIYKKNLFKDPNYSLNESLTNENADFFGMNNYS